MPGGAFSYCEGINQVGSRKPPRLNKIPSRVSGVKKRFQKELLPATSRNRLAEQASCIVTERFSVKRRF